QHALVDPRVAVLIDSVADLRLRRARVAHAALVGRSVAVVVETVAYLDRDRPTGTARVRDALVRAAVAVLIGTVARLDRHRAARPARVLHTLVDARVAVVVR